MGKYDKKASGGTILSGAAKGASTGAMFGPWGAAIGGALGGLGSALFGGRKESPEERAYREALAEYENLDMPDLSKSVPLLEYYKAQQVENPTLEADRAALGSAMENLPATDPTVAKAQMQALGQLQRMGNQGLDLKDLAAIKQIQSEQALNQRANREALKQQMEAKGMGSSGANLAMQLAANQSGANRAAQEQLAIAAQAQQAKRDALLKSGSYAGDLRSQQFKEQSDVAQAKDLFSKFNEEAAANRAMRNTAALRGAQEARLAEQQKQEASKVGSGNQMAIYRAGIPMAQYNLKKGAITDKLGLRTGRAGAESAADAAKSASMNDVWSGIQGLANTYGGDIKGAFSKSGGTKVGDPLSYGKVSKIGNSTLVTGETEE